MSEGSVGTPPKRLGLRAAKLHSALEGTVGLPATSQGQVPSIGPQSRRTPKPENYKQQRDAGVAHSPKRLARRRDVPGPSLVQPGNPRPGNDGVHAGQGMVASGRVDPPNNL